MINEKYDFQPVYCILRFCQKTPKGVQNLLIEQVDVNDHFTPKTEIIYYMNKQVKNHVDALGITPKLITYIFCIKKKKVSEEDTTRRRQAQNIESTYTRKS